jgi:multidrug resistance efflux pump
MCNEPIVDLADCTEFRQTLLARPPRIVHGTAFLVVLLLGVALVWSIGTQADLVVRAPGRVRPVTSPIKVFVPARGEMLTVSFGGRVVEVKFQPGDEVQQGDVLLRLDTERLDNEIAKRKRTIQTGREELVQLDRQERLLAREFAAAQAKADAELAQAMEDVRQDKERWQANLRLAESELENAAYEAAQARRLASRGALAQLELVKAEGRFQEAQAKRDKARLPVNESKVEVFRQAREQVVEDYALKRNQLEIKQGSKRNEVAGTEKDLRNLEVERAQAIIRAPWSGIVTTGDIKVGDHLEPGKPVVEIAEQKGFRFEVTVPSEEVAHLQVGMPARIRLDAFDYQRYGTLSGTVCFLSPDSGVGDQGGKVAYLVKIEVAGDEVGQGDLRGRVKLGMAGQAEMVAEQESLFLILVKKIRQTISLG